MEKQKGMKATSYYPKQLQVVNGHIIMYDKKNEEFEIKNSDGRKITTRKTELAAKNYANGLNKPSKKTNIMATKKPTPAQLEARKKFAENAKNGTFAKNRKTASPKRKTATTAKKLCSKVIKREGVKGDGTLKKGYKYVKGGKVVKAKPAAKKPVAKRKPAAKKK